MTWTDEERAALLDCARRAAAALETAAHALGALEVERTLGTGKKVVFTVASLLDYISDSLAERARLSERVKAGLETARGKGKRLGRKPFAVDVAEGVRLLTEERLSQRAAAKRMGLSLSVFHRTMKPVLDALANDARHAQSEAEGKADAASL